MMLQVSQEIIDHHGTVLPSIGLGLWGFYVTRCGGGSGLDWFRQALEVHLHLVQLFLYPIEPIVVFFSLGHEGHDHLSNLSV